MRETRGNAPLIVFPIDGSDFNTAPTTKVPASACQFPRSEKTAFGLMIGDTPVAKSIYLFTATNTGTVLSFQASVTTPGSAASVTIDLKKNGTTVLSAVITLTNASAAYTPVQATISVPSFIAGDEFTAVLAVGSSTGMAGVKCWANVLESAQPI